MRRRAVQIKLHKYKLSGCDAEHHQIAVVMRIVLASCVLFCLAIAGFGVHLVLEQQMRVSSFSATTTASVLEKRLERIERRRGLRRAGERQSRFSYEPVVKFEFRAQGREFTNDDVFPYPFRIGGNLGRMAAEAPLDRFEVGQQTTAYYNPENPKEACLIRRPSFLLYLVILLPMIVVSGLIPLIWRSSQPGDIEFKRRKGRWIASLWLIVGLASGGHYFWLAGADYGGGVLVLFCVYTQLGLIPVAYALPPSKSSEFARGVKGIIGFSFVGTFVGFWLGLLLGWLAMKFFSVSPTVFLQCWGYAMAISAAVFATLAMIGRVQATGELEPLPDRYSQPESVPEPNGLDPSAASGRAIPYDIDQRPAPSGEDLETLLPVQVGVFRRETIEAPDDLRNAPIYAQYRSESREIFVELGICSNPEGAQKAVRTAKAETDAEFPNTAQQLSLKTEPSFLRTNTRRGAFMAWTRCGYYFSAHARRGEKDLDQFMEAFPY